MKILVIHCTYKFNGGEETVVAQEQQLMKENGMEVEVLLFDNSKNSFFNLLLLPFNPLSYYRTLKYLRAYQPDIVHVHNLHFAASPSVLMAVKKQNIPLVMTLHNFRLLCPSAMLYYKGKPFLSSLNRSFPLHAILKGVYKNSRLLTFWITLCMQVHQWLKVYHIPERFLVLNDHAKKIFLNSKMHSLSKKFIIKPNFCYPPSPLPVIRKDFFLYIGRLTEEKGVRLILEAFTKTGFEIKIAGDGPLRDEVISYTKKYSNIIFLDKLSKEKVFEYMKESTALVFPSTWYEGMPLSIIEAFACGTPIIASYIGALETMVTHGYNGLHFEVGNKNDFIQKLTAWQALTKAERSVYQENARTSYEERYTPEKNRRYLIDLYRELTGNHFTQEAYPKAEPYNENELINDLMPINESDNNKLG